MRPSREQRHERTRLDRARLGFNAGTKGIYPIAATPFRADLSVDWDSLDRLRDFYQDAGATGITILGIMGEAQKLTPEESREIARRVITRSRVPVVLSVPMIQRLMAEHASCIMAMPSPTCWWSWTGFIAAGSGPRPMTCSTRICR